MNQTNDINKTILFVSYDMLYIPREKYSHACVKVYCMQSFISFYIICYIQQLLRQ